MDSLAKKPRLEDEELGKKKLIEQLKKQSDALWELREAFEGVPDHDIHELMRTNDMYIPSDHDKLVMSIADAAVFGAPGQCPKCSDGRLMFNSDMNTYMCMGDVTEGTKCTYANRNPTRSPLGIPRALGDRFARVQATGVMNCMPRRYYQVGVGEAVKNGATIAMAESAELAEGETAKQSPNKSGEPSRMYFSGVIATYAKTARGKCGNCKKLFSQGDVKYDSGNVFYHASCLLQHIDLKGKCTSIQGFKELEQDDQVKMRQACDDYEREREKKIKREAKAELMAEAGANTPSSSRSIWGPEAFAGTEEERTDSTVIQLPASATTTRPNVGKQFVKKGTVVDGECTVASETHVYRDEEGTLFSCSLTQADMATNRNSYFKMQMLQHDVDSDRFYVFKSWGRVGTELGGSETDSFSELDYAKAEFLRTFTDKTGNDWKDKKYFRKRPGKMAMVDMDYLEIEKEKSDVVEPGSITKLEKPVQQLVLRIFDKDMFKSALRSFDLDMDQMPLGKLSKQQLKLAYEVLNELQTLRQSASVELALVIDASNRFYSLIPHNFGHKPPEMIDTKEIIEKKSKLIENLMDIAIAVDLMNEGERKEVKMDGMAMDPIDAKYLALKSEITVLPKASPDYKLIEKYAENTQRQCGLASYVKYRILDVFRVNRQGEEMRFKNDLGNRMLLWHGSRLSNYVGIISQGLRIAPPEAPHAGYMFGKGIYFTDIITKATLCAIPERLYPLKTDAFLLLCDVALGVIQEEDLATGANPLKKGNTAVKAPGNRYPNPAEAHFHSDGYVVPCGKAMIGWTTRSTDYNEYIVYDETQVRISYLVNFETYYDGPINPDLAEPGQA